MKVDGRCMCGHITYEAVVNPDVVSVCHCTDCQRHGATAFGLVVAVVDAQFTLLSGALKVYVKTAESGNKRAQSFCPECGTRVHASSPGDPTKLFSLRVGTVNQRAELTPTRQIWARSALGWIQDINEIPSHPVQP